MDGEIGFNYLKDVAPGADNDDGAVKRLTNANAGIASKSAPSRTRSSRTTTTYTKFPALARLAWRTVTPGAVVQHFIGQPYVFSRNGFNGFEDRFEPLHPVVQQKLFKLVMTLPESRQGHGRQSAV